MLHLLVVAWALVVCLIYTEPPPTALLLMHTYISNPKQPSCKKVCGPQKGYGEKRYEIQGGGQEMAVMVG